MPLYAYSYPNYIIENIIWKLQEKFLVFEKEKKKTSSKNL